MTTTQNYNPLLSAFRELTTPEAFRWYGTQAKATATLAQTIAHYSFTTAQRLLSDSKPMAIASAIAEPENAKAQHQEYAQAEAIAPERDFGEAIADDGEAALSVGAVPLDDDDDTELRYWAELELPSILVEEYPPMEDDADNSTAGAEVED
jgi:hypothetical protein